MNLIEFNKHLNNIDELNFFDAHGQQIPNHFHVTELGLIHRHSVDCGKSIHKSSLACFQVWVANDTDHRLSPQGMKKIIELSEPIIGNDNHDIEVEYQTDTIGRYDLEFKNGAFYLKAKHTDCLAKDKCGVPDSEPKRKLELAELGQSNACCTPGGGCC